MTTAAGVAGGMLLAEGIRNMMGGGSSAQAQTPAAKDNADKDDKKDEQAEADDDRGIQEADYDPSHNDTIDWGGDLDI
jgi:hypothetical protein